MALVAAIFLALAAQAASLPPTTHDLVVGGDHWRIRTPDHGVIHVFRPKGYDARGAGVVVYIHGYYTDVDAAWARYRLAEQFDASGKDAVFIVAEAPGSSDDEVVWPSLGDLLRAVEGGGGPPLNASRLAVVGHSAAYRTLIGWLDYPPLRDLILLDALYGSEEDYIDWLEQARGHAGRRLTIVANDTTRWAEPFVKRLPYAQTVVKIPDPPEVMAPVAADARVLYVRSQFGHFDILDGGRVLPLILQRVRAKNLKPPLEAPSSAPAPGSP
jgi:hypothetical protein